MDPLHWAVTVTGCPAVTEIKANMEMLAAAMISGTIARDLIVMAAAAAVVMAENLRMVMHMAVGMGAGATPAGTMPMAVQGEVDEVAR